MLPDARRVREHRLLAWLGPRLHHPHLWHISREGIALGAALGVFLGLMVPVAQMPVAALLAIVLRANLPMAVLGTLITNPFTFAPIYYCAYRIGLLLTGAAEPAVVSEVHFHADPAGLAGWLDVWSERFTRLGKPLFVGALVLAGVLSVGTYFSIDLLWRVSTMRQWRRRRKRPES
jgi:hypothetical protein